MPLESCICVAGKPPSEKLDAIFCALSELDIGCTTPTLLSATIGFTGDEVTLVFDENVTADGSGFSIETDSFSHTLTILSGSGTTTLVFTLDPVALAGEGAFLFYDPNTGDATSGECPLLQIDGFEVTNDTGVTFNRVTSGGDFRVTSGGDNRVIT